MSRRIERLWYPAAPEGLARRLALAPLRLASGAFGAAARVRGALYDHGWLPAHRVDGLFVVSVGNLNAGGAGKTPVVIHLAERCLARGRTVAVLSRGYGRTATGRIVLGPGRPAGAAALAGDEPVLISRRCPGAWVVVDADRVAAARHAREVLGATVAILDDGFQHRRLARDLDVLVVDAAAAFGNGQLLPRGPLREPVTAAQRAGLVWLREDGEGASPPAGLDGVTLVRARHAPAAVLAPDGSDRGLAALRGQGVVMLTAIARPGAFRSTLEGLGAAVAQEHTFADHHAFTAAELDAVKAAAAGRPIVTTEKDATRLPAGFPVWIVTLGVQVTGGEADLARALERGL